MTEPMFDLSGKTNADHRRQPRAGPGDGKTRSRARGRCHHREPEVRRLRDPAGRSREPRCAHSAVACNVGNWTTACLVERSLCRVRSHRRPREHDGLSPSYPSLNEVSGSPVGKVIAVNVKGPFGSPRQLLPDGG